MRWETPLLLVSAIAAGSCRSKTSGPRAPITAVSSERKPRPSWVASLTKPLAATLYAPPGANADAIVALFDRYRKVNPSIKLARVEDATTRITLQYGAHSATIDSRHGVDLAEPTGTSYVIARTMHEVRDADAGTKHRVGFLVGEKQGGFRELADYLAKNHPTYMLEEVDTQEGKKPMPAELEALITTTPTEGIAPKELRRVDEFLMHGKPVALFMNNLVLKPADPSMNLHV